MTLDWIKSPAPSGGIDTTAIEAWLASIPAGGTGFWARTAAHYLFDRRVEWPDKDLTIVSDGANCTWLSTCPTIGMRVGGESGTTAVRKINIQRLGGSYSLGLFTQQAGLSENYPFAIIGPSGISSYAGRQGVIEGLYASGYNTSQHYWHRGFIWWNCWNLIARECEMHGLDSNPEACTYVGKVDGHSVGCLWDECFGFRVQSGFRQEGADSEAMSVRYGGVVEGRYGVVYGSTSRKPAGPVIGFHADVTDCGVWAENADGLQVVISRFLKRGAPVSGDYADIRLRTNSHHAVILGNVVAVGAGSSGASRGLVIESGEKGVAGYNVFVDRTVQVELQANAKYWQVRHNTRDPGAFNHIDSGVGNVIVGENL